MSKIKLLSIAVIGLLIVNVAIVAFLLLSRPMPNTGDRPPMVNNGPKNIIIDKLHFNKEQAVAYEALIRAHEVTIKSLVDSINITKNNLYASLNQEQYDGRDEQIGKLAQLQQQIELIHYEHFAAIKKLCKPDQLKYFSELTQELSGFFAPQQRGGPPPRK